MDDDLRKLPIAAFGIALIVGGVGIAKHLEAPRWLVRLIFALSLATFTATVPVFFLGSLTWATVAPAFGTWAVLAVIASLEARGVGYQKGLAEHDNAISKKTEEHEEAKNKAREEQSAAIRKIVREARPDQPIPANKTFEVADADQLVAELLAEREALRAEVAKSRTLRGQVMQLSANLGLRETAKEDAERQADEARAALATANAVLVEVIEANSDLEKANARERESHQRALQNASVDCEHKIDKALVDSKKKEQSHPLEECLFFEPYVDVSRPFLHRGVLHRGGLVQERGVSVRFGIRATNHGKFDVRVREIKRATFSLVWGEWLGPAVWEIKDRPISHDDGSAVIVPGGWIKQHVCTIDSTHPNNTINGRPYGAQPFGSVQIEGVFLIHGEWGAEAKPYQVLGSAPIPIDFTYTPEVSAAVDRLRTKLWAREIELLDADLSYGNAPAKLVNASLPQGLMWAVVLNHSTIAHFGGIVSTHEACSDRVLDKVVEIAEERLADALSKRPCGNKPPANDLRCTKPKGHDASADAKERGNTHHSWPAAPKVAAS